jgi:hypothetical protein
LITFIDPKGDNFMKTQYYIKYPLIIVCTQLLLSYGSLSIAAPVTPPTVIGKVLWVKGSLTAKLPTEPSRNLKRLSQIYEHDVLSTGPASEAKISFKNNSILSLHENSTIKIDQYWHPEKQEPEGFFKRIMKSINNGLRALTSKVTDNEPGGYKADPSRVAE